jgi:hypothetical protein
MSLSQAGTAASSPRPPRAATASRPPQRPASPSFHLLFATLATAVALGSAAVAAATQPHTAGNGQPGSSQADAAPAPKLRFPLPLGAAVCPSFARYTRLHRAAMAHGLARASLLAGSSSDAAAAAAAAEDGAASQLPASLRAAVKRLHSTAGRRGLRSRDPRDAHDDTQRAIHAHIAAQPGGAAVGSAGGQAGASGEARREAERLAASEAPGLEGGAFRRKNLAVAAAAAAQAGGDGVPGLSGASRQLPSAAAAHTRPAAAATADAHGAGGRAVWEAVVASGGSSSSSGGSAGVMAGGGSAGGGAGARAVRPRWLVTSDPDGESPHRGWDSAAKEHYVSDVKAVRTQLTTDGGVSPG